jgi:formylglycine-generating enzyme required for sulfatase activity
VREGTLRGVARDLGLSAPAVQNFIDGAEPRRPATLRKLEGWYMRHIARTVNELDVDAAMAALRLLVRDLPAERQWEAAAATLRLLEDHYLADNAVAPPWIERVRLELERGE